MNELIFISVFNYGAIEIAKNHLQSLINNNIQNYIAYVTDEESYNELLQSNYKVKKYISKIDNINKDEKNFDTQDFNTLSYIRYIIINDLLNQGKTVWYLDTDIVVLQNLNDYYNSLPKNFDILFQNDINMLCSGCMLINPNIKTLDLTNYMYSIKNNIYNDQIILNNLIQKYNIYNIGIFNENNFPNGLLYFNELKNEPYFREVQIKFKNSSEPLYLVHANYMIGISNKINALKSKNLWFI